MAAGDTITMELVGFDYVITALQDMSQTARNRIVRPAITKAARPVAKDMKRRARPLSKTVSKSIGQQVTGRRKSGAIIVRVGPRTDDKYTTVDEDGREHRPARTAHLLEFGAGPHIITGPKGIAFSPGNEDSDFDVVVQEVSHPGHAPTPFMRPAAESQKAAFESVLRTEIGKNLEKEWARRVKKASMSTSKGGT